MAPLIGISGNFFHPDPNRDLFKNKRLVYFEQEMSRYLAGAGAAAVGIPHPSDLADLDLVLEKLDGVLLAGGADVSPASYGKPVGKWPGDKYHDEYELKIINHARNRKIPILGVCRGCQIINVAYGGTLHQDLIECGVTKKVHRDPESYDKNVHGVSLISGTKLHQIFGQDDGKVISVHHQGVDTLGKGLQIAARSEDNIVEAVESTDPTLFVVGVQWHPEWTPDPSGEILDAKPLVNAFISAARN